MLRIALSYLLQTCLLQRRPVGLFEYPVDATRQVFGIAVVGYVAVLLMVYHLRYTSYPETDARHAARHRLHDGVREVIFERWQHEGICRIVDCHYLLLIADIAERIGRQGEVYFLGMAAQDGDGGILLHLGIARYQPVDGFDEITHALAPVGYALGYEEDDMLVGWQTGTQTRLCLILRTEHVGIYRIRDVGDALTYEETAALSLPFEPTATGDEGDGAAMVEFLLAAEYLC